GGELAATRAGAGTGAVLELRELRIAHLPARVRADRFENVLDRDVVPVIPARSDGTAVEHESRKIEPRERHGGAGDGFIAADEARAAQVVVVETGGLQHGARRRPAGAVADRAAVAL